MYTNTCEEWG